MDDRDLVEALLRRDRFVTQLFFYRNCRPLFQSLIQRFGKDGVRWEYDELVSEVYMLLMEDEGRRLRSFTFKSSFYQWLKVVTLRMMMAKRDDVIEDVSQTSLYKQDEAVETGTGEEARADLERLLAKMPNRRYAEVVRKLTIEGYEMEELARELDVNIANLYNIKRRAMAQLTHVALSDKKKYGN